MRLCFAFYAALTVALHLEVTNTPLVLLPLLLPKQEVAVIAG